MKLTKQKMKNSLLKFAGAWKGEKKEMVGIFEEIKKERKRVEKSTI